MGALVTGGFALLMYWVRQRLGNVGLTSPIALFATYFVGVLVGLDRTLEAFAAGLAIALLLFTRERLHHVAEVMTPQEMEGALYFLVLAFILYPVLPKGHVDPWDLLDLRALLLIVLFVSLISFASFLAIRRWGSEFGLPFSGFLGGLVNSDATTVSLAHLQKRRPGLLHGATLGIFFSTGTLFLRNLVIAAIAVSASPDRWTFLLTMAPAMLWASFVYLGWALVQVRAGDRQPQTLELDSPFAFRPAFFFALWFTLVSILTFLVADPRVLGEEGTYLVALGGLVSAAAVTASMGALVVSGNADVTIAATTAVVASLLSAANKPFLARVGGPRLARQLWIPTGLALTVGSLLLWATPQWLHTVRLP